MWVPGWFRGGAWHACVLALVCGLGLVAGVSLPERVGASTSSEGSLADLPEPLRFAASREMGADDERYRFARSGGSWTVETNGLTTTVGAGGTTVAASGWSWGLRLRSVGAECGGCLQAAPWRSSGNELRISRGPVEEWWVAGPLGVQQGWTVASRPAEGLLLRFDEIGSGRARVVRGGSRLDLGAGRSFEGLHAYDALGKALAARFVRDTAGFGIRVDDRNAVYPVTVDPWVQGTTLTAPSGAYPASFGWSVALSSDGGYALVGDTDAGGGAGAAFLFTKPSGASWATTSTAAALTRSGPAAFDRFGWSVALSSDGGYALVGAPGVSSDAGAVYLFTKPSGAPWATANTSTAVTLTRSGGGAYDIFGHSVALSSDGGYALVGAAGVSTSTGAAYLFTKPSGTPWATANTSTAATLTRSGGATGDEFGTSVALSSDGGYALVGAKGVSGGGAAYLFTKPSGTPWATANTSTAATFAASGGLSVALSSDGGYALVGAIGVNSGRGAAYLFTKPSGAPWATANTSTAATLTRADAPAGESLGVAVALSSGGDYALVGAGEMADPGGAYLFTKPSGAAWATTSTALALTPSSGAVGVRFGWSVALSGNGAYRLVGAPAVAGGGAAYGPVWVSTDATLSALALSGVALAPVFASATTSYTASVSNVTSSITVTPTTNDANATVGVRVGGAGEYAAVVSGSASEPLVLSVGTNVVQVLVMAEDVTTTATTTVTVTRAAAEPDETVVEAALPGPPRAGYCLDGVFLDLEPGQPDRDPWYAGATPAITVPGKGLTCAATAPATPPGAPGAAAATSPSGKPVAVPVVTKSERPIGGSVAAATIRHVVSLADDPAAVRLSFDGGATSKGWVESGASFSVATAKSVAWVQTRDATGATSGWTRLRLAPPRVVRVERKKALRGKPVQSWLTLSEDPDAVRVSLDAGRTSTGWFESWTSVGLLTERKLVWVQVRTGDGSESKWQRVRLAPPIAAVVRVKAGATSKQQFAARHSVTLSQDLGSVRLSFDGGNTTRSWADVGKQFTVYTTLPAVWVQVRDARDGAVSRWKRIPLPRPVVRALS